MIGEIKTINSPRYGSYIVRSVCIVDFKSIPYECINLFIDKKLHPRGFFPTHCVVDCGDGKSEWFIPLTMDNKNLLVAYCKKQYKQFYDKVKDIRGFEVLELNKIS